MKLGMVLSLALNLVLATALLGQSAKMSKVRQEIAKIQEDLPNAIRSVAQVGFITGCLSAYTDSTGSSGADNPLWPVIQDACMQGAVDFADTIKFTERK